MNIFKNIYRKVHSYFVAFLIKLSPYLATVYLYRRKTGKSINLKNPRDLNEKIHWLKLYWKKPLVIKCGDKYEVRDYVKNMGFPHILNELHGVYENVSDIEWDNLPNKFVLKVTSGSGFNIICMDKSKIDKQNVKKKLNKWMKTNFALKEGEMHYQYMKPRIICEKFMETNEGAIPADYKVFCFNGKPEYIMVALGRESNLKRYMFDTEWNNIDFLKEKEGDKSTLPKRPESLKDMIFYSERLSEPFPFVRIDFYNVNGEPILGEMTFTPGAGFLTRFKDDFLKELGNKVELPNKRI